MKFRYYVVFLDGTEPQGTDDTLLAQRIADTEEQAWVIDTDTGLTLDDDPVELEEVDPADYDDPEDIEGTGDPE